MEVINVLVLKETLVLQLPAHRRTNRPRTKSSIFSKFSLVLALSAILVFETRLQADTAPSTYSAYTGTDTKLIPPAPALGPANSIINDPTFGSRILRVTDQNTQGGESFISTDAGFHRTWNADSTAIKLTGPRGDAYWLEFNPGSFNVGDGSSHPVIHAVPFGATWEWSTVDPNIIYFLNGNQIAKYNKSTGVATNLGGPPTNDTLGYMAVVIGLDNWVCAAAGSGQQDSYSKIFCINPISPSTSKFIDVYNKTINGAGQGDPNWPASAPGQVIGIHDISGGTGASWLEVTFHQQSWGGNGGAVFNLATNTWSLVTASDPYWSGHVSMGNGKYANDSGSVDGRDSRGLVIRNPDNLMNSSQYLFAGQPPDTRNGWCDADHSSWLNSAKNPNAPILISRYTIGSSCQFAFTGEIDAAAVDGSNTVWRFAHNHNGGFACYYAQSFAQISNDGRWAVFSSYWDGALGADTSFGCATRIDTFVVELSPVNSTQPPPAPSPVPSSIARYEQTDSAIAYSGSWSTSKLSIHSGGSAALSMDAGSRATFTFTGTGISWIGYRDEWSGIARVYVDNVLRATVDTFAAPAIAQTVIYSVAGLASTSHTLVLEAVGRHNTKSAGSWVWLDAFDVTSGAVTTTQPPPSPGPLPSSIARYEQTDSAITYSGSWSMNKLSIHSGGSAALSMDAGSRATFTFIGTAISWIGYRDEWSGIARIYVDNVLRATVDTFASPATAQTVIYSVAGLASTSHTLVLEAVGTHNTKSGGSWVWLDAFDVTSGPVR